MFYQNKRRCSILFLGFLFPDDIISSDIKKDRIPQIQTCKFSRLFYDALTSYLNKDDVYVLSARPISCYPGNPKVIILRKKWRGSFELEEISYINLKYLNLLTRFISSFISTLNWIIKNINRKKLIIIYSVHVPFMLTGYLAHKIFRIHLIGIWTDPPALVQNHDSKLSKLLRNIEIRISKFLMSRYSGCIVLAEDLAKDYAPNCKRIVIEAIYPDIDSNILESSRRNTFTIIYAGNLSKDNGIEELLRAFCEELRFYNMELWLFGKGELEELIKYYCLLDSRIKYFGLRKNNDVIKYQKVAHLLVNLRKPDLPYTKYTFPSKISEYICSGTPILSTRLSGIPQEYFDYIITINNCDHKEIADRIIDLFNISVDSLNRIAENALKIAKLKGVKAQGLKIYNFIDEVMRADK